jgi:hypothetical protein
MQYFLNNQFKKMKQVIFFSTILLALIFASCKKCSTCIPYNKNGTENSDMQRVKVCSKTEIDAYQTGKNFVVHVTYNTADSSYRGDTLHFICQ